MDNTRPAQSPHSKSGVLEHALSAITETLERTLFAEEASRRPGLLQGLDARVKLISVLALLLSVSLSHSLLAIGAMYAFTLALGLASAIPAGLLIKRVWLALPFFTGMLVLPALFITPGPALLNLPLGIAVTTTGLNSALFLLLRVSTSVSLTLLLILTTPWNTVLSALSVLKVPDVFILILGMTYRYVFLLLRVVNDMFLSRKSRVVRRLSTSESQKMLAAASATLLNKSLSLSTEVYLAMQSRGFRGSIVTLKPFHMRPRDWIWLCIFLTVSAAAVYLGRSL